MGIIKAIKEFIADRGYTLMFIGFAAAVAGVSLYAFFIYKPRFATLKYPQAAAMGLAVLGFAVYFTGRISVYIQRSRSKREVMEMLAARDKEDDEADD
jgi:uncharacterized membrane protein